MWKETTALNLLAMYQDERLFFSFTICHLLKLHVLL